MHRLCFVSSLLRTRPHVSAHPYRRHKDIFARTDAPRLVKQIVVAVPVARLGPELAGLAVNMTLHPITALEFVEGEGVRELLDRATRTRDPMVMRLLRNLSWLTLRAQQEEAEKVWSEVQAGAELPSWAQLRRRRGLRGGRGRAGSAAVGHGGAEGPADADAAGKDARAGARGDGRMGEAGEAPVGDSGALMLRRMDEPGWGDADTECPSVMDTFRYRLEGLWAPLLRDIVRLLSVGEPAMQVEVLGMLANLTPRDFPSHLSWADVLGMPGERRAIAACWPLLLLPAIAS